MYVFGKKKTKKDTQVPPRLQSHKLGIEDIYRFYSETSKVSIIRGSYYQRLGTSPGSDMVQRLGMVDPCFPEQLHMLRHQDTESSHDNVGGFAFIHKVLNSIPVHKR
jgi:hypothetical protein